jgi:hypothetical protein
LARYRLPVRHLLPHAPTYPVRVGEAAAGRSECMYRGELMERFLNVDNEGRSSGPPGALCVEYGCINIDRLMDVSR